MHAGGRPHPRNAKCFCGSNKKYKKCHGAPMPCEPEEVLPASVQESLEKSTGLTDLEYGQESLDQAV